ncbi:hypothetical protein RCL1_004575 [Eukaryota sp. TZLM3-RCL]
MNRLIENFLPATHHYLLDERSNLELVETKSLNIVKRYRDLSPPSARENLQNWRDQCFKLSKNFQPNNPFPSPTILSKSYETYEGMMIAFDIFSAWCSDKLLGWALQTHPRENSSISCRDIIFFNNDTVLTPDILRFGHTDKNDSAFLAGHFGDGLKPEINRLLACGAHFKIVTGCHVWSFYHDEKDSLMCDIYKNSRFTNAPIGTLIHISNIQDPKIVIDIPRYLFLQSEADLGVVIRFSVPEKNFQIQILMEERFHGKIFLHGIFVKEANPKFAFGVDYHAAITAESGLGIERNNIDDHFIWTRVILMCISLQQSNNGVPVELLNELRLRVFDAMNSRYSVATFASSTVLGDFLLEGFVLKNCDDRREEFYKVSSPANALQPFNIIPLTNKEKADYSDELKLFGYIPVCIESLSVIDLLRKSPRCPVMDKIRLQFTNNFLALPELIPRDAQVLPYPADVQNFVQVQLFSTSESDFLATQLRDMMVELISDVNVLPFWSIRFKQFPPNSKPKPVTPLRIAKLAYYIVDLAQFAQVHVHSLMVKDDSSFRCEEQNCSCVHIYFFDELIRAIDSVFPAMNRKSKANRKLQHKLMAVVSPLKTVSNIELPPEVASAFEPISNDAESSGTSPFSPSPQIAPVSNSPRKPNSNYIENVVKEAVSCVKVTGTVSKANVQVDHIIQAAKQSQVSYVQYLNPAQEINLVKNNDLTSTVKKLCNDVNINVYNNPQIQNKLPEYTKEAADLAGIVASLWSVFYAESVVKCNVFVDESSTIAFNRGGQLFFNVFYHKKLLTMNIDHILSHWFIVYCHELAHNKVKNHGEEFGYIVEHLALTFIPSYVEQISRIKQTVNQIRRAL